MNVVSTHIMKDDSAKCGVLRNMNLLPLEIVHRILEYDGRMKYRHGKYMNQIAQDDDRYKMLLTMPIIEPYPNYLQHGYLMIVDTSNKIYCEKKSFVYSFLLWRKSTSYSYKE